MTTLAASLAWLVIQVSAVALIAAILESSLGRRCPAAAARLLAFAFVAVGLLTLATIGPLPNWWTWQPSLMGRSTATQADSTQNERAERRSEATANPAAPGRWFSINLPKIVPTAVSEQPAMKKVGRFVATIWLAGVAFALIRLFVGWLATRAIRRQSQSVSAERALDSLANLKAKMNCIRRVELRAADMPGLPATAGWLRPIVILPLDWRSWSDAELQAALAHELGHIKAGDFLLNAIAHFGLALHFYHPLIRWLMKRLQLRQELAADALAAQHAGGSHEYLRALATLALRSQRRCSGGPARLFLSAHGGAMVRRVQMLRNAKEARPVSRAVRGLALAIMACSVVVISAVRGPAQTAKPTDPPAAVENKLEPFDLSYFSTDNTPHSHAIIALRPSVILALPGMETFCKQNELGLAEIAKRQGGSLPEGFSLTDIDQIVAEVRFESKGTGEPGSRSIMIGSDCFMLRMKKDMDWDKFLKTLFGNVVAKKEEVGTLYTIKLPMLPGPMNLFAPDNRTLIPAKEKDGKPVAPVANGKAKPWNLGPGWKQVERAHFAYFYDNRDHWWSKKLTPELKQCDPAAKLVGAAETACAGAWFGDGIRAKLIIQGATEADAKLCQESLDAFRKLASEALSAKADDGEPVFKLGKELLLKAAKFERDGSRIESEARVGMRLADLVKSLDAKAEATAK